MGKKDGTHTSVFTAHFENVKAESVWLFDARSVPELTLIPTLYLYSPEPLTCLPEWVAVQLPFTYHLQDGDNSSAQHYLFIYPKMDFKGSLQSFDFETSQP